MKSKENHGVSFLKQAFILAVAGLIVRFLGFLYRIPLTAMIGDAGNGIYSSGYYIYTLFLIMSSAGLPAAISKMVSERVAQNKYDDAHNVFRVAMLIAGVVGFLGSIVLLFGAEMLANFVNNPESKYSLISLSPTLSIVALMAVFRGYFQGLNTTVPTALSQVVEQVFNAIFSVYLAYILLDKGVEFAAAGGTAGTGIGALAGLIFIMGCYALARKDILKKVRRYAQPRNQKEARKKIAFTLIKTAIPIIIGTAIFSITNLADMKMVLSRLYAGGAGKEEALGLYGQLTGKYVVLTTLPVSFATALATAAVPNIAAAMLDHNSDNVKRKVDLALRTTMLISFPSAVGIGVLGDQIIRLLWPTEPNGGILLQAGCAAIIFLALSQICTGALQGIGRVRIPAIAAGFGALVKIALNYFLIPIPEINVIGAVISTIGCYVTAGVINFYFLIKFSKVVPDYANIFIKPLISSLVMGVACYSAYYIPHFMGAGNNLSTVIAILVSVFIYFLFMLYLGGIKREDVLMAPSGQKLLALLVRLGFM